MTAVLDIWDFHGHSNKPTLGQNETFGDIFQDNCHKKRHVAKWMDVST